MDKIPRRCRKWARISKPNDNLFAAFMKKSMNDLAVLGSIPHSDKEWRAATAYYARYHMLTALLLKIGIDCKDHNCSIEIAEHLLPDIDKEMFSDIKTAKKHRINLQYYTDRAVDEREFARNMESARIFVDNMLKTAESLTREKIESIKRNLK